MEFVCEQDAKELNDAGKEQVGFRGEDIGGFTASNAEGIFEGVNGAFDGGSLFGEYLELGIVAGNSGIKAQV